MFECEEQSIQVNSNKTKQMDFPSDYTYHDLRNVFERLS